MHRGRVALALGVTGVAAAVAVRAFAVEPQRVHVTRHRLRSPAADGASSRVRLVHLTDLHLHGELGLHERRVAARVNALRPDVVAITGDAVNRREALPLLDHFLQLLDPSTPKVATVGNWELAGGVPPAQLARLYERHNGRLLRNASARLRVHDAELLFTGLDDEVQGRPDPRAALAGVRPAANHLLLAHCPRTRDRLPRRWASAAGGERESARLQEAWRASARAARALAPRRRRPENPLARYTPVAILAGHTHGGQIAPFGVAPYTPRGSGAYTRGWYRDDGALPLYVSVGLGTVRIPARLGALPEIAVFDWEVAGTARA